ncbi:MAG: TonB-dependent receptor [Nitrospirae bacterium]|nr:TonB-dependent receptor [Nitrospirota bacterium]
MAWFDNGYCGSDSPHENRREKEAEFDWIRAEGEAVTTIATKTKLDADEAPGSITILKGRDLERMGVRTVAEALELIPGVYVATKSPGSFPVFRGIGLEEYSGKIKYMVDGIPWNFPLTNSLATYNVYMPIGIVDKIEVIRGPGSALYGKNAYSGVINVVLNKEGQKLFAEGGSYNSYAGGGTLSYAKDGGDFKATLNVEANGNNPLGINSGYDSLYGTENQSVSAAPGKVNDKLRDVTASLKADYKTLYLVSQLGDAHTGVGFGYVNMLTPYDTKTPLRYFVSASEAGWKPILSDNLTAHAKIGYNYDILNGDPYVAAPPGFTDSGIVYKNGMIEGDHTEFLSVYGGAEIQWDGLKNHRLLAGLEYENIRNFNTYSYLNYDPANYQPLPGVIQVKGDDTWLGENLSRNILSAYLQDQFTINERFMVTGGLRYDGFSDTGDRRITPRLAGVYKIDETNIVKAQYAEAFRPPGFMELYSKNNGIARGNKDLRPETLKTIELGYIYRTTAFTGKVTLFYSWLKDLITVDPDKRDYENIGDAASRGGEFEATWKPHPSLTINGNLSYVNAKDKSNGLDVYGSVRWLHNESIIYEFQKGWFVSATNVNVGRAKLSEDDSQQFISGYDIVNAAISADNVVVRGMAVVLAVRNVFDTKASSAYMYPGYSDGYRHPGRLAMIQVSYRL